MRRCLMLATIAVGTLALFGCGDGVAYTKAERMHRTEENLKNDCRQLNDDWDYLWLNEHKGHLSRWQVDD
jgi:hypothetical protein